MCRQSAGLPGSRRAGFRLAASLLLLAAVAGPAPAWSESRVAQVASPSASDEPSSGRWLGADLQPLPLDAEGVAEFLRTADVLSSRDIATGITRPKKLLLERDGIQAHAIFRYGDTEKRELRRRGGGTARWVRDSYRNEVAAYELSRLLGMDNLPVAVERQIRGVPGSVQIWIEEATTEEELQGSGAEPADPVRRHRQIADRQVFDELIGNVDRNAGNTLVDRDGGLWLIDHTRAFGRQKSLLDAQRITRCSHRLWQGLRALDERTVEDRLLRYLGKSRTGALLARRQTLIDHLEGLIAERGEGRVLFRHGAPAYEIQRR